MFLNSDKTKFSFFDIRFLKPGNRHLIINVYYTLLYLNYSYF